MGQRRVGIIAGLGLGLVTACDAVSPEAGERIAQCNDVDSNPSVTVDFARDIRPIMHGDHGTPACSFCHAPGLSGQIEGGFIVATLGDIRAKAGVIVPGKPCESAIVQKLRGVRNGARMPKNGPYWRDADIQLVHDWIAEGANGGDAD